jgi:hypothetical protein
MLITIAATVIVRQAYLSVVVRGRADNPLAVPLTWR